MTTVHKINCAEIWGGNRGDELFVETSGIRACLFSRACDGGKGGDIYHFSVCEGDLLTRIAIADVVGHGKAVSDTSRWLYDSLAARMNSADGNVVLADLNEASVTKGYQAMSTATVAAFYRENSNLYFSYAGHHELLLCKAGESDWMPLAPAETEDVVGLPLGVIESCEFRQRDVPVSHSDRLFIYTDGVIEAMDNNGKEFGVDKLRAILNGVGGRELTEIRQAVADALSEHTDGTFGHDDVTFMIIEFSGASSG